jgi:hypothetical protein
MQKKLTKSFFKGTFRLNLFYFVTKSINLRTKDMGNNDNAYSCGAQKDTRKAKEINSKRTSIINEQDSSTHTTFRPGNDGIDCDSQILGSYNINHDSQGLVVKSKTNKKDMGNNDNAYSCIDCDSQILGSYNINHDSQGLVVKSETNKKDMGNNGNAYSCGAQKDTRKAKEINSKRINFFNGTDLSTYTPFRPGNDGIDCDDQGYYSINRDSQGFIVKSKTNKKTVQRLWDNLETLKAAIPGMWCQGEIVALGALAGAKYEKTGSMPKVEELAKNLETLKAGLPGLRGEGELMAFGNIAAAHYKRNGRIPTSEKLWNYLDVLKAAIPGRWTDGETAALGAIAGAKYEKTGSMPKVEELAKNLETLKAGLPGLQSEGDLMALGYIAASHYKKDGQIPTSKKLWNYLDTLKAAASGMRMNDEMAALGVIAGAKYEETGSMPTVKQLDKELETVKASTPGMYYNTDPSEDAWNAGELEAVGRIKASQDLAKSNKKIRCDVVKAAMANKGR